MLRGKRVRAGLPPALNGVEDLLSLAGAEGGRKAGLEESRGRMAPSPGIWARWRRRCSSTLRPFFKADMWGGGRELPRWILGLPSSARLWEAGRLSEGCACVGCGRGCSAGLAH
jgi:hypothetical protein